MSNAQVSTLVAALALALALTTVAGAGTAGPPTVRFVRMTPAKVRGAQFIPSESVRVTLRAGSVKRVRTTRASASGGFTVDFGLLREKDRCGVAMTLTAVGGHGDRATYRLPPRGCTTTATE